MVKRYKLKHIKQTFAEHPDQIVDQKIKVYGRIVGVRSGDRGAIAFVDIGDGTTVENLCCCAMKESYSSMVSPSSADSFADELMIDGEEKYTRLTFDEILDPYYLSRGCSVVLHGIIKKSPIGTTQLYEMHLTDCRLIGSVGDPQLYPIQKSIQNNLISLRSYPFDRMCSKMIQCLFEIRAETAQIIHQYFSQQGVKWLDPNIITGSDCEGAGETFKVIPEMFGKDDKGKNVQVGLTVSSQLPLEALICGHDDVYTFQKSFRAERSKTNKHLAEFTHLERETAFTTLPLLMDGVEQLVKHVMREIIDRCVDQYTYLESQTAQPEFKGIRHSLLDILANKPFVRITHHDAIALIQKDLQDKVMVMGEDGKEHRLKMTVYPKFDGDLDSEHEKYLVQKFGTFVFVTHWPISIKSFYMKQTLDGTGCCESFDLLAPRVGEMFGGSMREWRYDVLLQEITKRKMDITPLQWFVDLRKKGSAPHGGWGMGFDRMVMFLTGAPSVRDVVPFPVYYEHCPY
jgi:asparaginyl-tRNA synthetase